MIITGIGSRKAPEAHLKLFYQLGYRWCMDGFTWRSGGAKGSDEAFWFGYIKARNQGGLGRCEVYLPGERMRHFEENGRLGVYNAASFGNWRIAEQLALSARGGSGGLNDWGIRLHTRNAYQVLGRDLATPSNAVVCSAPLTNNPLVVKGGTNTAVTLAHLHNVPVWNMENPLDLEHIERYLAGDAVTLTHKDYFP